MLLSLTSPSVAAILSFEWLRVFAAFAPVFIDGWLTGDKEERKK